MDLRSLHCLHGKLANLTDSSWSTVLERNSIEPLAHVNSAISGDDVSLGLAVLLSHDVFAAMNVLCATQVRPRMLTLLQPRKTTIHLKTDTPRSRNVRA